MTVYSHMFNAKTGEIRDYDKELVDDSIHNGWYTILNSWLAYHKIDGSFLGFKLNKCTNEIGYRNLNPVFLETYWEL